MLDLVEYYDEPIMYSFTRSVLGSALRVTNDAETLHVHLLSRHKPVAYTLLPILE